MRGAFREFHLVLYAATGSMIRSERIHDGTDTTVAAGRFFDNESDVELIEIKEVIICGKKIAPTVRAYYLRADHEHHARLVKKAAIEKTLEKERSKNR